MSIFSEVRQAVSAKEAALRYGLELDRQSRALCPFHQDRHPSMTFRYGRFRCWSCDASGDSIELVGRLLGISPYEAACRINRDFGLGLKICEEPGPERDRALEKRRMEREAVDAFKVWRDGMCKLLSEAFKVGLRVINDVYDRRLRMEELSPSQVLAIRWNATIEYWSDLLVFGTEEEQMFIFRKREEITKICKEIIQRT